MDAMVCSNAPLQTETLKNSNNILNRIFYKLLMSKSTVNKTALNAPSR